MKHRRAARALATTLIIGLAAGPLYAQDEAPERRHGPGKRGPSMMHGMEDPTRMIAHIGRWLELDEQQQQELENIALASKPQLSALRDKGRANHDAIRNLDPASSDYDVSIHALAAENGQIATELTLLMAQLKSDIHAVLTPEQQQQLATGRESLREMERKRRD